MRVPTASMTMLLGSAGHEGRAALNLISSPALLAEFADVIRRPKFPEVLTRSGIVAERLVAEVQRLAEIVDPPPLGTPVRPRLGRRCAGGSDRDG
jgi:hypothetical protein